MYDGSGTVDRIASGHSDAACALTGWQHFLCEMISGPPSWKCDIKLKIWLHQSMRIYLRTILSYFIQIPFQTTEP